MSPQPAARDTVVAFVDDAGQEYRVRLPRAGHTDREVRTVAYRWACKKIAEGEWTAHGELTYLSIGRA